MTITLTQPKGGRRGEPYIGPSESQSIAMAAAPTTEAPKIDRPHLDAHWRSRKERRPVGPPTNVDELVAWFAHHYALEVPDRLHGIEPWADHGTHPREVSYIDRETGERVREVKPGREGEGGSLLGSPKDAGLIPYVDSGPNLRDDEGDLVRPMRSALAAYRRERMYGHSLLMILAEKGFDWRSLIGKAVYRREHRHGTGPWCHCPRREAEDITDSRHLIVMALPEDILEDALVRGLTHLWWLLSERGPHIREV